MSDWAKVSWEDRLKYRDRDLADYKQAKAIFLYHAPWDTRFFHSEQELGLPRVNWALKTLRYLHAMTSRISEHSTGGGLVTDFEWYDFPGEERASDRAEVHARLYQETG